MIRVETKSGSVYDVDMENKTACRRGDAYRGDRAAPEPRKFEEAFFADGSLVIVWRYEDGVAKSTITSPVVGVERVVSS